MNELHQWLQANPNQLANIQDVLLSTSNLSGDGVVDEIFTPTVHALYCSIASRLRASELSIDAAVFTVSEISYFARYNSQFLKQASKQVADFCPELSHELMRNHLEEGGERGKLPAHYIVYSNALIRDLGILINGYAPHLRTTYNLVNLHQVLVNSHCPSTILGMYYATESVAAAETIQLLDVIKRIGSLKGIPYPDKMPGLEFYFRMHLDATHIAATNGVAVELGHQDGLARFVRDADTFKFLLPQVVDGFLQSLSLLTDQWFEIAACAWQKTPVATDRSSFAQSRAAMLSAFLHR